MNGGHYQGHERGWCLRCDAIEKMMNRLNPAELARGIRKLNKKIRTVRPLCWPGGCFTASWATTAGG